VSRVRSNRTPDLEGGNDGAPGHGRPPLDPFSSGIYVNVIADPGDAGVGRAYQTNQLARLAELKRKYDPDNVFHLNQNIRPAPAA
jgi:hypothetical protein